VVRTAGIEPARALPYGFSYHFGFRRRPEGRLWSGLSLHRSRCLRCRPSSLYTFRREAAWLGIGRTQCPWLSPNLSGSTSGISPGALNRLSPLRLPISPRPHWGCC